MKRTSLTAVLLVTFTSFCFAAIVALKPAKPVAYWPANGNTRDAVAKNNGVIVGNVRYQQHERLGKAFNFDGNHSFVAIQDSPSFQFQDKLSIELWMKASPDNPLNNFQGLIASDFFGIEISNGYGGTMGVNFYTSSDAGASWGETSTANGGGAVVTADQWHHIVGVYDGTQVQLYIDGKAWGKATPCSGAISPMLDGSYLSIGGEDGRTFCGCTDRYFEGAIDEVKIYNRALSGLEIQADYNQEKSRGK